MNKTIHWGPAVAGDTPLDKDWRMATGRIQDWQFGRAATFRDKMERILHRQLKWTDSVSTFINTKEKVILNTIDDDGVICTRDARQEGETGRRTAAAAQQSSHDRQ